MRNLEVPYTDEKPTCEAEVLQADETIWSIDASMDTTAAEVQRYHEKLRYTICMETTILWNFWNTTRNRLIENSKKGVKKFETQPETDTSKIARKELNINYWCTHETQWTFWRTARRNVLQRIVISKNCDQKKLCETFMHATWSKR